ncbi:Alpha/Beta hydrolase protein [Xylogone sp. PMI_703]|nr:Alpha/Beta hydrolase protein [Xylogone sp. PMI_703]
MLAAIGVIACILSFSQAVFATPAAQPTALTKNGTYEGFHIPSFNQEAFYGIPFALPPVGPLRLRHPVSYNQSWTGRRNATVRSASCPGYDGFSDGLTLSEDCLTLDIVRPANTSAQDKLPVFVWIYGGGFKGGGIQDPRYNTSFIVRNSMDMNKPIIAVAISYRLMGFGFLGSKEVLAAGVGNVGLFDQRLALRWISENIQGFGGDPTKVTIAGESAGGSSVGYHMVGFDGRHDQLFRAVIVQSGSLIGAALNNEAQLAKVYQPWYDNITATVGCDKTADSLECLRTIPYSDLYNAMRGKQFKPLIDGTFISRLPSQSLAQGLIADVAIIMGSNTDEGTATFFGPRGTLNTTSDVDQYVAGLGVSLNSSVVNKVLDLYPDDPALGCPFQTGGETFADQGAQYKRGAAITGDWAIQAGRRYIAKWKVNNSALPIYTYRFDQPPWNGQEVDVTVVPPVYVTHYTEICFVFDNPDKNVNWIGPFPSYANLAKKMSRMWAAFVHDLNPNHHGIEGVPRWPQYSERAQNIVFRADQVTIEKDDYRAPQFEFWNTLWPELQT